MSGFPGELALPFFSVIIATYNRPQLLARALASLSKQDCDDFEVIVIDDASPQALDLTPWHTQLPLSHYRNPSNFGVSKTRNFGIEQSRGQWVLFLDDDDEILPGALVELKAFLLQQGEGDFFTWCGIEKVTQRNGSQQFLGYRQPKVPYKTEAAAFRDAMRIGCSWGVAVRRQTLLDIGMFDTGLAVGEDTDLILKLLSAGVRPTPNPKVLIRCQVASEGSLSKNQHLYYENNVHARLILRHHRALLQYPSVWSITCLETSSLMMINGAFATAWEYLKVVAKIGQFNTRAKLLWIGLSFGVPFFWLYNCRPGAKRYKATPVCPKLKQQMLEGR